jgi:hypothetical protein
LHPTGPARKEPTVQASISNVVVATPVPAPLTDRVTILTPKGEATRHAYKLARALRALDDETRDEVLGILYVELADPQTA